MTQGFVYAIGDGLGHVKIGWSLEPDDRLDAIQTGCAGEASILGVMPGTMADERGLHRKFRAYRLRGEWFDLKGEVAEFVATLEARPTRKRKTVWRGGAIESVGDILDALGGNGAVAIMLRTSASRVSNWRRNDQIPPSLYTIFRDELKARSLTACPSLFGMSGYPRRVAS